jgi:hypothetical protein
MGSQSLLVVIYVHMILTSYVICPLCVVVCCVCSSFCMAVEPVMMCVMGWLCLCAAMSRSFMLSDVSLLVGWFLVFHG